MKAEMNSRLASLPPYIFVHLGKLKLEQLNAGKDVIDLGQGSPDLPSPKHVVEAAAKALHDSKTHGYPIANGTLEYRQAIAEWYRRRFGAEFDADKEVLPLIGSKEGIGHLLMAVLEPGDGVLVPSPCYPVHYNAVIVAGGKINLLPLKEKDGFLPDLDAVPASVWASSKILILNYPNNPTGA